MCSTRLPIAWLAEALPKRPALLPNCSRRWSSSPWGGACCIGSGGAGSLSESKVHGGSRIASLAKLVHRLNQRNHIFHRRLLMHAVSKIENVPRARSRQVKDLFGASTNLGPSGQQDCWIEIALNG